MKDTVKMEMQHKMSKTALELNVVPGVHNTLVSVCTMADADYITVLDKDEANIYDCRTTKVTISEEAILKCYRCKRTGLWILPLKKSEG